MPPYRDGHAGLSPRARGSPDARREHRQAGGSIPAGAGKPYPHSHLQFMARVYPRGRGEAATRTGDDVFLTGLSPRARGSHSLSRSGSASRGSIPAGAGKPIAEVEAVVVRWVYPRGRGEAVYVFHDDGKLWGLSPRARGSRTASVACRARLGSIPAGAGKPSCALGVHRLARVYPRGRGEAEVLGDHQEHSTGLSPRARGSRYRHRAHCAGEGSIPAGAGKPATRLGRHLYQRVYPRGRGEAEIPDPDEDAAEGLSPRARGSQLRGARALVGRGSIPAGAGKPTTRSACSRGPRVYPRGRGEATCASMTQRPIPGLSPRARGSPSSIT